MFASGSAVLQCMHAKRSLCVCVCGRQVRSIYMTQPSKFHEQSCNGASYADILRVGNASGADLFAMLDKQLASLGVPSVGGCVHGDPIPQFIRIFTYTSDAGPDQMHYRRAVRALLSDRLLVFWVDVSCLLHVFQLIVKQGLLIVDRWCKRNQRKWSYYSSLSKVVHCIHEQSRAFFLAWRQLHDSTSAVKFAKRLPPKCIAGRWGSIHDTGAYMMERSEQLPSVLSKTITEKADSKTTKQNTTH